METKTLEIKSVADCRIFTAIIDCLQYWMLEDSEKFVTIDELENYVKKSIPADFRDVEYDRDRLNEMIEFLMESATILGHKYILEDGEKRYLGYKLGYFYSAFPNGHPFLPKGFLSGIYTGFDRDINWWKKNLEAIQENVKLKITSLELGANSK